MSAPSPSSNRFEIAPPKGGSHGSLPLPTLSAVLFVLAALGGFVLIGNHAKGRLIPKPLMGVHATAAVIGFVLLLIAAIA